MSEKIKVPVEYKGLPAQNLWSSYFPLNWFYVWCIPIANRAVYQPFSELKFRLRNTESARYSGDRLQKAWNEEISRKDGKPPSILKALFKSFGVDYLLVGCYKVIWAIFTWLCAYYFLKLTLNFVQRSISLIPPGDIPDVNEGHWYAVALLICALLSSIAIHQLYGECNRIGIQVKGSLNVLIYRKVLTLSRVRGGAGEVVNLLSTDVTRVVDGVLNFHFLWSAFFEVTLIVVLSFIEIGLSALPALAFILFLTPVQMYLGKLTSTLSRDQTQLTTQRVHIMSEILTAIKLIKFYAWEKPFSERINDIRTKEMEKIRMGMIIKSINFTVVFSVPILIALSSLSMYVGTGNTLTASLSFTILSLYNTLRYPFFMLPMAVRATSGAFIAFTRLEKYLSLEDVEELKIESCPKDSNLAFEINGADFNWDGSEGIKPTLENVNLSVKKGQKVAIIGDVGSGKSSLLAALLGQIRQVKGDLLQVYGSVSYVPQQAWLLNETLRDNILFGLPLEMERYKEVIRVCSLQRDLTLLLAGDQTELAERGANLSGGQRQRSSLARAVYSGADIVLLDDPISAVDQHVGRHIFEECFLKFLGQQTVIIAMHQLQYLPQMDWIVVMKDGAISMQGTFIDLMEQQIEFSNLMNHHVSVIEDEDDDPEIINEMDFDVEHDLTKDLNNTSPKTQNLSVTKMIERNQLTVTRGMDMAQLIRQNELSVFSTHNFQPMKSTKSGASIDEKHDEAHETEKGKLVQEDLSTSASGLADLVAYFKSATGVWVTTAVCLFFAVVHGIRIGSDYWLRLWVPRIGNFSDGIYIGIYGMLTVLFTIGVLTRGLLYTNIAFRKSILMHNSLFNSVLRAPMSFFDMTPLGRILSAFSKHLLHVDDSMPDAALQMLQYLPLGLGALILSAALIPWNWAPCLLLFIIACFFIKYSSFAIEKTKSLEAITKAPVFAHTTTSLEGVFSIRAYHAQDRFDHLNIEIIDRNHEALFALQSAKSFQALYLDVLSSFVVYFSAMLIVVFRSVDGMPSIAGLALSNALQMLVFVQWTVRMWGDVNAQLSSVGQVIFYADIPSEAPADIPETKPDASWPTEGKIEFNKIVLRYQKFGVDVLKDITFTIHPREKIGIVGRTGSGKSTLLISLLRIVEAAEGTIHVDGIDVSTIGLADLRSRIAIIPQEPVLFVGTVRTNLDPFHRSEDTDLWKALDAVNLGQTIRNMSGKLDSEVIENGSNFSLGQRQCFCIARAILAKTKILVLDEATAAIDMATDLLIQNTIKTAFADLTVVTIAHRLNTIIDCDRVMVMDAGKIVEFDEPINLLNTEGGSFKSLVDQTGDASAKKLYEVAQTESELRKLKNSKQ